MLVLKTFLWHYEALNHSLLCIVVMRDLIQIKWVNITINLRTWQWNWIMMIYLSGVYLKWKELIFGLVRSDSAGSTATG